MEKESFIRSKNDSSLFIKGNLFLILYVEDLLILGNDKYEIESLSSNFRMNDAGRNDLGYLGICIKWEGVVVKCTNVNP